MLDGDRFDGIWGYDGQAQTSKWGGTRKSDVKPVLSNQSMASAACDWTGTWSSSIGDLRFIQNGNQVSGQHRTVGQISATAEACRLDGMIENTANETRRDFTITKSDRRFDGTWSWQDGTNFATNIWSGTLRSSEAPVISQPVPQDDQQPIAEDAGSQSTDATPEPEPSTNEPEKETVRTWRVTLHSACERSTDEDAIGVGMFGLSWIKARVTHKNTGEEIMIAPVGGFPNLKNDKERVFDVKDVDGSEAYQAYLGGGQCATYTQSGFKAFFPDARKAPTPISLDFKIDAAKFGYDDIHDLMSDRKNRIRVMSKLEATKALGFDLDFGTVGRSTPLQDADFCGSCKLKMRKGVELFFNYMPGTPIGDGVLSGFKDGSHEAAVFYDIKPLD